MNYTVSKIQVQTRKIVGGMANLTFKTFYGWPSSYESLPCRWRTIFFFFIYSPEFLDLPIRSKFLIAAHRKKNKIKNISHFFPGVFDAGGWSYHFFRGFAPCGALGNPATTSAIVSPPPCYWGHSKGIVECYTWISLNSPKMGGG